MFGYLSDIYKVEVAAVLVTPPPPPPEPWRPELQPALFLVPCGRRRTERLSAPLHLLIFQLFQMCHAGPVILS